MLADARAATALASASLAVVLADARAATALAFASLAVVFANARAATALALASYAVVFADARAPTLSAIALFAIVGALLADRRHLQVLCAFCCFLQTSQSQREAARSTKHLREAARSAKREAALTSNKHLLNARACGLRRGTSFGDSILRKYFTDLRVKRGPSSDSSFGRED